MLIAKLTFRLFDILQTYRSGAIDNARYRLVGVIEHRRSVSRRSSQVQGFPSFLWEKKIEG